MSVMEGKDIRVICDEGYSDLRQQVLERDNFTCRRCRCTYNNLDTQHIIPRRYGGSDSLDNIMSYCRQCQEKWGQLLTYYSRQIKQEGYTMTLLLRIGLKILILTTSLSQEEIYFSTK